MSYDVSIPTFRTVGQLLEPDEFQAQHRNFHGKLVKIVDKNNNQTKIALIRNLQLNIIDDTKRLEINITEEWNPIEYKAKTTFINPFERSDSNPEFQEIGLKIISNRTEFVYTQVFNKHHSNTELHVLANTPNDYIKKLLLENEIHNDLANIIYDYLYVSPQELEALDKKTQEAIKKSAIASVRSILALGEL